MQLLNRLMLPVFLSASVSLLAACATTTAIDAIERKAVCEMWKPWYWSVKDTDESILQARENNKARESVCGRPEPKK